MSTLPPAEKLKRRLARYPEALALVDSGKARPNVVRVVALLRQGLIGREIAERMGLSWSQVRQLLGDPTDEKNRARKARHNGTCRDCGGATSYGSGDGPSERCGRCHRTFHAERNSHLVEMWEAGVPTADIARELGMSEIAVRSWVDSARHRNGRALTLRRLRDREAWPEIERLWNEGLTGREIGERLGTSQESVWRMVQAMRARGVNVPCHNRRR